MRVLVVDDEVSICACLAEFLRGEGFEVTEAYDGVSALALASEQGAEISVVLTDVNMPKMSGIEMWRRMRSLVGSNCRILFMSGVPHRELAGMSPAQGELLRKPFELTTLLEKLSAAAQQLPGARKTAC